MTAGIQRGTPASVYSDDRLGGNSGIRASAALRVLPVTVRWRVHLITSEKRSRTKPLCGNRPVPLPL